MAIALLVGLCMPLLGQWASCTGQSGSVCLGTGNVGVGTQNPAVRLDIAGTQSITANTGADLLTLRQSDGTNNSSIGLHPLNGANGATIYSNWTTGNGTLNFAAGGYLSPQVTIDQSGNVGIGTAAPSALLHINRVSSDTLNDVGAILGRSGGSLSPGANRGIALAFQDADNQTFTGAISGYRGNSGNDWSGGLKFFYNPPASARTATVDAMTQGMILNGLGRVGIGTSAPGYLLDVQGQINAAAGLCIGGTCQTAWPGSGVVTYSGGNVGIGTSNPTEPLVVNGSSEFIPSSSGTSASETFWINTPKNNVSMFLGDRNQTTDYAVNDYSADIRYNGAGINWGDIAYYPKGGGAGNYGEFRFSLNGSSVQSQPNATLGVGGLYVNGKIGIGTASPQYPLAVNGTIQAKEVVVNTGWSDYVFDPDYQLAPLSDVAAYVARNHHLPDIPSAKEVQEKGASLGEMQAKLLAKIEELTLHVIAQQKEINELKRAVQEKAK